MAEPDKLDIPEGRFPGNSNFSSIRPPTKLKEPAAQDEEPPKQIGGGIKQQKKSLMQRLADAFIATDGKSIKDYMIYDVLIPVVKRTVEDIVHMTLYDDKPKSGRITRSRGESRVRRVGFNSLYDSRREDDEMLSARVQSDQPNLIFDTQAAAEEALDMLAERIDRNRSVSLKYYYSITRQPTDWTQSSWGWRSMAGASVVPCRDGYLLKLPRMEEL